MVEIAHTHVVVNMAELSGNDIPDELRYVPSEADRKKYGALWEFLEAQGFGDEETKAVVAYTLRDGTYLFSVVDSLDVWMEVAKESVQSDRLLSIVSLAYLEDQLRLLLAKYFIDDDVSHNLLDPNQSALASMVPMANLAYSMGLLAKEWLEILKQIARLRNVFAHTPSARSFDDLATINPKYGGLMEGLKTRYRQWTNNQQIDNNDFRTVYNQIFMRMYHLLQFSIDHLSVTNQPYDSNQLVNYTIIDGFNQNTIQQFIAQDE